MPNKKEVVLSSSDTQGQEEDFSVTFASKENTDGNETVILTSEDIAKEWMSKALQSFDPSNGQYSVYLKEQPFGDDSVTLDDIKLLSKNAQSDITKILKINALVRQEINGDDIIGKVYETMVTNLNSDIKISFDNLPSKPIKKYKDKAESLIKQFHRETNINTILSSSIPTVYVEGNCIKYLRSKNGHYVIDSFPLGVAIVSDYKYNGIN